MTFSMPPPPPLPPVPGNQQVLPPLDPDVDVRELARQYTALAIQTLAHIAGDPTVSSTARVAAATALLERGHGKNQQAAIEVGEGPSKIRVEIVG